MPSQPQPPHAGSAASGPALRVASLSASRRIPLPLFPLLLLLCLLLCSALPTAVHAQASPLSLARLGILTPSSGQLIWPAPAPHLPATTYGFNSEQFDYVIGMRASTAHMSITATRSYTPNSSPFRYRYTTKGSTSAWINMTDNVPTTYLLPNEWVIGDLKYEVEVTSVDASETRVYTFNCVCDEPQLTSSPGYLPMTTFTPITGKPSDIFEYPPPARFTYRIWPPTLGAYQYDINVTGGITTPPQCVNKIGYFIGDSSRNYPMDDVWAGMITTSTPGELQVRVTLREGYHFLYILGLTPAGRDERHYYLANPPMSGFDMRMPGASSTLAALGLCPYYNNRFYEQLPCTLPVFSENITLSASANSYSPPIPIYLNGVRVFEAPLGQAGGTFPLREGVNTYLIAQPVGNYTGQIIVPPRGGYGAFVVRIRGAASKVKQGVDMLLLAGELTEGEGGDPRTRAEDLEWEWSATPYINFSDPRVVIPQANSSQLVLSQRVVALTPNTTYVFTARAWDAPTRRDGVGARRNASATFSVRVEPRVETVEYVAPTPSSDPRAPPPPPPPTPCDLANPCLNGGRCSFVPATANTTLPPDDEQQPAKFVLHPVDGKEYALYCSCPQASPQFFGSNCGFAILQCLRCTARYVSQGEGEGQTLTVLGIGLTSTLQMQIAGVPASLQGLRTVNASDGEEVVATLDALSKAGLQYSSLTALTFIAPPLLNSTTDNATTVDILPQFRSYSQSQPLPFPRRVRSAAAYIGDDLSLSIDTDPLTGQPIDAYVPLQVAAILPGARTETVLEFRTLVFYTSSACLAEGEYKPDGRGGCLPCPPGSYCPGAGRVWPYPGYYGYSEYTAPAECRVPEACTGMDMKLAAGSAAGTSAYFAPGNEGNKCTLGYQGAKCSECTEGYFQLQTHCYLCEESVDQSAQLTLTLIAVLLLAAFLSVCVALLSTEQLCAAIGHILMAQTIATIGVSSAPSLPTHAQEVETFFTWMDLINFNLGLLRPGCGGVPTFTFVVKFFSTMLFMLAIAVLFFVACCVRYYIQRRRWNQLMSAPITVRLGSRMASAAVEPTSKDEVVAAADKDKDKDDKDKGKKDDEKNKKGKDEEEEEDEGPPLPPDVPRHDFKKRLEHSYLILLALMYLRVTTMLCENFICLTQPEPVTPSTASNAVIEEELLLDADGSTLCYSSGHAASTAVAIIVIVVYMIGFPLFCFVRLLRAFGSEDTVGLSGWAWRRWAFLRGSNVRDRTKFQHTLDLWTADNAAAKLENEKQQQAGGKAQAQAQAKQVVDPAASSAVESSAAEAEAAVALIKAENDAMLERMLERDRSDRFGFLYDGLTSVNVTFVVHMLFIQALFAVVGVFLMQEVLLQLFLFNLLTFLDGLHTAYALPWEGFRENIKAVAMGSIGLVQGVILLGTQEDGTSSPYFGLSVAMCGLLPLVLFLRRNSKARRISDGIEEEEEKEGKGKDTSGSHGQGVCLRSGSSNKVAPHTVIPIAAEDEQHHHAGIDIASTRSSQASLPRVASDVQFAMGSYPASPVGPQAGLAARSAAGGVEMQPLPSSPSVAASPHSDSVRDVTPPPEQIVVGNRKVHIHF